MALTFNIFRPTIMKQQKAPARCSNTCIPLYASIYSVERQSKNINY
jgi:hypothetical protein